MRLNQLKMLLFCLVISIIGTSCATSFTVEGTAMKPTLNSNDRVFLTTYSSEPSRGDIIALVNPKNKDKWLLKRVIGLPNETIEIKKGRIFIDDEELNESYIDHNLNLEKSNHPPKKIPKDNYYVLGDNRDNSADSRIWGTVSKDSIQGKFLYRYAEIDDPYK